MRRFGASCMPPDESSSVSAAMAITLLRAHDSDSITGAIMGLGESARRLACVRGQGIVGTENRSKESRFFKCSDSSAKSQ